MTDRLSVVHRERSLNRLTQQIDAELCGMKCDLTAQSARNSSSYNATEGDHESILVTQVISPKVEVLPPLFC